MTRPKIMLRKASIRDLDNLLFWRNDPLTREMSLVSEKVSKQNHKLWLANALKNDHKIIYIGTFNNNSIGMCRFDIDADEKKCNVNINLNPAFRGKHLSIPFLRLSVSKFRKQFKIPIIAQVKKINQASIKLFISCDFNKINEDADLLYFEYFQ